jgi:hypothetical protein
VKRALLGGLMVSLGVLASDARPATTFEWPAGVVVAANRDRLHECRAFEREAGGFTVVCRVARSARKLAAVNLSDEGPLVGVAVTAETDSIVRIDLPVAEGTAEARLVGYLDGNTAVVVRAEATWARGEDRPTLSLVDGTRRQLVASKIRPWVDVDFAF